MRFYPVDAVALRVGRFPAGQFKLDVTEEVSVCESIDS
jgi:hypothetical protein